MRKLKGRSEVGSCLYIVSTCTYMFSKEGPCDLVVPAAGASMAGYLILSNPGHAQLGGCPEGPLVHMYIHRQPLYMYVRSNVCNYVQNEGSRENCRRIWLATAAALSGYLL